MVITIKKFERKGTFCAQLKALFIKNFFIKLRNWKESLLFAMIQIKSVLPLIVI